MNDIAKNFNTNIVIGGQVSPTLKKSINLANKYASKASNNIAKYNDKISKSMRYVNSRLASVSLAFKNFAKVSSTAIAGAGVLVGKSMIDQASSMEQYRNTLNVVLKDTKKAGETFKWATQFANMTPFETSEIVESTVKLTSYGLEAQKVLPLVGDMASAMGKSIDQATEAIADAQTGELERLKEFGITKEMIVTHGAKKLAGIEIVNNKGQITNQRAFNAAMFSLMKERYNGSMEIQSKTFKGLISTTTGIIKTGLAQIAGISSSGEIIDGSAFDLVKEKLTSLTNKLLEMQANGSFDVLREKFSRFASNSISGLGNLFNKLGEVFNYIKNNGPEIQSKIEFIGKAFLAWKAIQGVTTVISTINRLNNALKVAKVNYNLLSLAKIKDKIETLKIIGLYAKDIALMGIKKVALIGTAVAQGALNVAMSIGTGIASAFGAVMAFLTSPIGLVVLAIGALIGIVYLLWKNWDTVSNFMVGIWQNYVLPFFQGIGDFFGGIFEGVSNTFKGFLNIVISGINFVIDALNGLNFTVPEWVPFAGGKEIGLSIPKIPMFARGGIATGPSIFGEAGPEMAIPLKRNNPRSLTLLEKTSQMLGVKSSKSEGITIVYSPTISGNAPSEIKQILQDDFEKFKEYIDRYLYERERDSYGDSILQL